MRPSLLATDGYKLSMAEAGWPLRRETFYYTHRRGGVQLLPFDAGELVRAMLPAIAAGDDEYLTSVDYEMGGGFKSAIAIGEVEVQALAKGAWFLPREPIISITGPSALASWLEPLLLQFNYRIQVATLAERDPAALARAVAVVACKREREIVGETLEAIGVQAPAMRVDADAYYSGVLARAKELVAIAGSADRLFEVGLRSATCVEQHIAALEAVKEAGITRTSHVAGARALGMSPIGTMGHEHVQRFGSDREAFRAMRDRRPARSSYLLDTFDAMTSGIPAALALIAEAPTRRDSVRYDSGDQIEQMRHLHEAARAQGLSPVHILEDGYDAARTRKMEAFRESLGLGGSDVFYGYGGYLVSHGELTRDRVAAVYKLSQTDHLPVMKFAGLTATGKRSVPGRPVVHRRVRGDGPMGVIAQDSERVADGYVRLTGSPEILTLSEDGPVVSSPATRELEADCERRMH